MMHLIVAFTSILLISNILANRMVQFFYWTIDAGTLTFSMTYILSNIFSEVYGYYWSRRVTWTALGIQLFFALLIKLVGILPKPEWVTGDAFNEALSSSWRIVIASLVAYCIGDFVNDRVFRGIRRRYRGKGFWWFISRALTSSVIGNIVDTSLFCLIAFSFIIPWNELPGMIIAGIGLKSLYETVTMPITYRITQKVAKYESISNGGVLRHRFRSGQEVSD
jgi:uncharacterized integral membrane protein (TIGR00697 family)